MKNLNFLAIILLVGSAFIMPGCKKEGCTDPDSVMFDPEAKSDDGSCLYEGNAVIWYGQTAAIGLQNDGATSLTFYVDGQIVGSTATNVYWAAAPDCGANGSISITKDLGSVKSLSYTYSVKDQTGWEYWSGVLNVTANNCQEIQLIW